MLREEWFGKAHREAVSDCSKNATTAAGFALAGLVLRLSSSLGLKVVSAASAFEEHARLTFQKPAPSSERLFSERIKMMC